MTEKLQAGRLDGVRYNRHGLEFQRVWFEFRYASTSTMRSACDMLLILCNSQKSSSNHHNGNMMLSQRVSRNCIGLYLHDLQPQRIILHIHTAWQYSAFIIRTIGWQTQHKGILALFQNCGIESELVRNVVADDR